MKTLYIVRHAKSSWKYPLLTDFERPLNQRGRKNARRMGTVLQGRAAHPDLILSSPANRAATTARLIATALQYPLEQIQYPAVLYQFDAQALIPVVQQIDDASQSVMIVGHQPAVSALVAFIAERAQSHFPTAAVCCLNLDIPAWAGIAGGCGQVIFCDRPNQQASPSPSRVFF